MTNRTSPEPDELTGIYTAGRYSKRILLFVVGFVIAFAVVSVVLALRW